MGEPGPPESPGPRLIFRKRELSGIPHVPGIWYHMKNRTHTKPRLKGRIDSSPRIRKNQPQSAKVSRDRHSMKRKPSWDMKEERADEADNPGPNDEHRQDLKHINANNKRGQHTEEDDEECMPERSKLRKITVEKLGWCILASIVETTRPGPIVLS